MPEVLEADLKERIRKNEAAAFEKLYDDHFPIIAAYVKQNSGSEQDSQDVFQEAMMVLVQNLRKPEFVLTASAGTYIYSVARNIWLKRLRDNKAALVNYEAALHADLQQESAAVLQPNDQQSMLDKLLNRITSHCRHLLVNIFLKNEPIERLMKQMGWKNKHSAANQKYKCLEQVKKVAATSPDLQ